jgi:putative sterol carrier protein
MIASVLYPETRGWWQFRNTIGMGYYNSRYLEGIDPEQVLPRKIRKPKRIWLKAYGRKPEGSVPEEVPGLSTEELSERVRDAFNGKDLSGFTDPAVFAFKIPNRDDAGFAVRIENGTAAVSKDPSGADITITISEKNLLKILNGKLMPVVGYATKRLKINGDMGLALKLQNLF